MDVILCQIEFRVRKIVVYVGDIMILVSRKLKRVDWPEYKCMVGNSENNEQVLFPGKYKGL